MAAEGADEKTLTRVGLTWDTFGISEFGKLAGIIGHVRHVHGKFLSIVDGDEPDLMYEGIVHALLDLGYSRWLLSEYEGISRNSLALWGRIRPWCAVMATATAGSAEMTGPDAPLICRQPLRINGDDAHPVWHRRTPPVDVPRGRYPGFRPETLLLRGGDIRRDGARPLPCDTLSDRNVPVTSRDGVVVLADVYRPTTEGSFPSIIAWSPYGKQVGNQHLDDLPGRFDVPLSRPSDLRKWEARDAAAWAAWGYAILQPDSRGSCNSGGAFAFWGRQLAEDGCDYIAWTAAQPWSGGRLGMAGKSWLAISLWFIAAERAPHLLPSPIGRGFPTKYWTRPGGARSRRSVSTRASSNSCPARA